MFLQVFTIVFSGIFIFGFALLAIWLMGLFVFAPFYEKTLLFKPDSRFRISDIIVLAIHIQIVAAIVHSTIGFTAEGIAIAVSMSVVLFCWWSWAIRMMSRSGVSNTKHRWLFMGMYVPLGYVSGGVAMISLFGVPMTLMSMFVTYQDPFALGLQLGLLCLFVSSYIVIATIRKIGKQICEQARDDRASKDGIEFTSESLRSRRFVVRAGVDANMANLDLAANEEGIKFVINEPAKAQPAAQKEVDSDSNRVES